MKTKLSAVLLVPALGASALVAATFTPATPEAGPFSDAPLEIVGAAPRFAAPERRAAPATRVERGYEAPRAATRLAGPGAPGAQAASPSTPAAPARPTEAPAARAPESAMQYVYYCFGPLFGNDGREVDPNYMPLPTASNGSSERPTVTPVHYTRTAETRNDETVWVGADGSRITYLPRNPERDAREAAAAQGANAGPQSVEELIAENRRELTKISWARVYRRHPELQQAESPERGAFDSYVARRQADARDAALFENPMWPETVAADFTTAWQWKKAEAESWDRVRSRVRVFNDGESTYTRRFLEFAADLRRDPEAVRIFQEPTWPEKALELHDERIGPVPAQFR